MPRSTRSAARRKIAEAFREQNTTDKAEGTQDIPGVGNDEVTDKDYVPSGEEVQEAQEEAEEDLSSIPVIIAGSSEALSLSLPGTSASGSGSPKVGNCSGIIFIPCSNSNFLFQGSSPTKRRKFIITFKALNETPSTSSSASPAGRTKSPTPTPSPPGTTAATPVATPAPGGSTGQKEQEPNPDDPNDFMPAKKTPVCFAVKFNRELLWNFQYSRRAPAKKTVVPSHLTSSASLASATIPT